MAGPKSSILPAVLRRLHGWKQRLPYARLLFVIEEEEQEKEAKKKREILIKNASEKNEKMKKSWYGQSDQGDLILNLKNLKKR